MSDTPRTDAAIIDFEFDEVWLGGEIGSNHKEIIEPDFARTLERELAETKRQLEEATQTIETLAKHHRGACQSRNDHASNYRKTDVKRIEVESERDRLRADLERFTGSGLLDCHAICDQRDAAVAEGDSLRAELAACRAALHLTEEERIVEQTPTLGSILIESKGSRRRVSPATENECRIAADLAAVTAERDALKTQIHDLCHDKHIAGPVTPKDFCDGCEAFQIQLFGSSPITALRTALEKCAERMESAKGQVELIKHKFERAGGVWKVANSGVELGRQSWASNVENGIDNAAIDITDALAEAQKAMNISPVQMEGGWQISCEHSMPQQTQSRESAEKPIC